VSKHDLLKQMWLAGEKREVIAIELGVSVDWVKKWRRRLQLPARANG
jgi:uncharacterized protein YjcR